MTQAYGYTKETLRVPTPAQEDVRIMDLVLGLVPLIDDIMVRRIVNSRCLVTPLSGRYLFSYKRIALLLHSDQRLIARLHGRGLIEIAVRVSADQASTISRFFTQNQSIP